MKSDQQRVDDQRMRDWSEAPGPSFVPVSDGSGHEQNPRLRTLNELNQHPSHPTERRTPGFPSTFGPLARAAQEQAELGCSGRR
jgi:hypothetical protein